MAMRKPEIQSWEEMLAAEIADWERSEVLDDPFLADLLQDGEEFEELSCGCRELDAHRWELDPASAEDYPERNRGIRPGPALKWRHFGH